MDIFHAHYADIHDPAQQPRVAAQLRDQGLVTFSGIADRAALVAVARRLMTIRPHRDAGPDGVTVIADTQTGAAGYAAFTDAELVPHTDGSSVPDPPGLLLLACQRPADEGGTTRLADGARIVGTLAERYPAALRSLSAPRAAFFGAAGGSSASLPASWTRAGAHPAPAGRPGLVLRPRDCCDPAAGAVITGHLETVRLRPGEGLLLSNTRWLHGRDRYTGRRIMLRILGDPLPSTGVMPGFPSPSPAPDERAPQAA